MQGQRLDDGNPHGLLMDLPQALWELMGHQQAPRRAGQLRSRDNVATAARCGCVLVRKKKNTKASKDGATGYYKCSVCEQKRGRNQVEVSMLNRVKALLKHRQEHVVVCCQFPLGCQIPKSLRRCDVVLVPLCAQQKHQLIGLELDGTDHAHKPRQNGLGKCEAYNRTVDMDNAKRQEVHAAGMRFTRVSVLDMHQQGWEVALNEVLDALGP